ncbi:MAG: class I tRNA ligase family protein, partial [Candidatus Hodarchaeales archaeon]
CLQGSHGTDIRFSLSKLDGNAKFLTKIWNIARFISSFPEEKKPEMISPTDNWILSSQDALIHRCNEGYSELDFSKPAENIYNWVWNIFAPHYIELAKQRAYNENEDGIEPRKSVHYTLHNILSTILKLLAPITPFVTEYLYQKIYQPAGSIHLELLPKSEKGKIEEDDHTLELMNLNSFLWKIKKEKGLSLKERIDKVYIPESLKEFIPDLKQMHNIRKLSISHEAETEKLIKEGSFAASFEF